MANKKHEFIKTVDKDGGTDGINSPSKSMIFRNFWKSSKNVNVLEKFESFEKNLKIFDYHKNG